ncbi:hypothetical protein [Streptomyces sp. NPDC086519]|uniref:hypothetical protein n=1 Tax=Streptomyces sp. NPDC086519 TaxID=3154863 RepID=UPI00342C30D7
MPTAPPAANSEPGLGYSTVRRARPEHRLDQALRARGGAGNIGGRPRIELRGCSSCRPGGGARETTAGAGRRTPATPPPAGPTGTTRAPGGSGAFARPPAGPVTGPDCRPALLVSAFIPKEEPAPGECGRPAYWRELWGSDSPDVTGM